MIGDDGAIANHHGRIEDFRPHVLRVPGDQGDAAHFLLQPLERAPHLQAHAGMEQEVLRRVARHGEFRHQNHVRTMLIARSDGRGHDARRVAVDIADDQIELRQNTTQLLRVSHSIPYVEHAILN